MAKTMMEIKPLPAVAVLANLVAWHGLEDPFADFKDRIETAREWFKTYDPDTLEEAEAEVAGAGSKEPAIPIREALQKVGYLTKTEVTFSVRIVKATIFERLLRGRTFLAPNLRGQDTVWIKIDKDWAQVINDDNLRLRIKPSEQVVEVVLISSQV